MHRIRLKLVALTVLALAACARPDPPLAPAEPPPPAVRPEIAAMYGAMDDNGHRVEAVAPHLLTEDKARQLVDYWTDEAPGTIIVDPHANHLYQVQPGNKAMRYTVAVGAAGYGFTGAAHIPYQRDWPSWKPTDNMVATNPELYGPVEKGLEGGVDNPMGARALYLHNSQGDTYYRIHGTMDPASIGGSDTAGCIRLFNQDIIHLASQTDSMTRVIVLTKAESGSGLTPPVGKPRPRPVARTADATPDHSGETT
ncbi:Lipoprotein-anchoring transpeptidase ErfK/SrfK [Paracoccus solventivorans]|uniref:Lipoprotein-anchoring transpeptidase ErfK/SrfK n=1 Tax=Paracoccus solventivorans TaxID=53463 RepID=A0A1M7FFI3_9RHOB|nr:L,D-transpeptidase [Paracoccus solventivorans]SHM02844.1 Lipoprotein-anchoring transpeptidase ErfK/SrfK [Paracoccus solventivorans]